MLDALDVTPDFTRLLLTWQDGCRNELPATVLRQQARDAASIRERHDFGSITVASDIRIIALEQVGPAGVNIHFSDGHKRAIFPFEYLKELSQRFDN